MSNVIVAIIILILVVLAIRYIVNAKKKGQSCIGCPHSSHCSKHCHDEKQSL